MCETCHAGALEAGFYITHRNHKFEVRAKLGNMKKELYAILLMNDYAKVQHQGTRLNWHLLIGWIIKDSWERKN